METKRNQKIDLLKFMFSVCIIGIHGEIFKNSIPILYKVLTMGLFRIGVPFFFVVSGYYFYRRIQENKDTKTYLKKYLKLFCIFEGLEILIYTGPMFFYYMQNGIFAYLWRIITVGLGGAYWYLTSMIISFLILIPFWKKKSILPVLCIGFVLYLFVMTNDSYSFLFNHTWVQNISKVHTLVWTWPQAGLWSSLFYLSIGAYIYENKTTIKYDYVIVFMSLISLLIEAYFCQSHGAYDANTYFSLIILVPTLFIYCLNHPTLSFDTKLLGELSLYIYLIHPITLSSLRWVIPLPVEFVCIIVACITIYLSKLILRKKKILFFDI